MAARGGPCADQSGGATGTPPAPFTATFSAWLRATKAMPRKSDEATVMFCSDEATW